MLSGKEKSKMSLAVLRLCNPSKFHSGQKITGRKYEHIKMEVSKSKRGVKMHPNTKIALEISRNKNGGPNKGKKMHPNTKEAISAALKGKPLTDVHKQKLSSVLTGRTITDNWRANMSSAAKSSIAAKNHLNALHKAKIGTHLSAEHKQN